MPQNGAINRKFGIYETLCCGAELVINPGVRFPDCPNHPKLTTIWKPLVEEKISRQPANEPQPDPVVEAHIENRRLFNLAAGRLRLQEREQEHLHECEVCQGVLHVLINQPMSVLLEKGRKPPDAA